MKEILIFSVFAKAAAASEEGGENKPGNGKKNLRVLMLTIRVTENFSTAQ